MTDFRELLRQHGAPAPKVRVMETEVRSEGALAFHTLAEPGWTANLLSSSNLAEWRCTLEADALRDLQIFLTAVPPSGRTVEELLSEAFVQQDIGCYLGTFIEEGMMVAGGGTVRILFAYRSKTHGSIEKINQAIYDLLHTPPPALADASAALRALRGKWQAGSGKTDGGLMMLSGVNLNDPGSFPYSAPPPSGP